MKRISVLLSLICCSAILGLFVGCNNTQPNEWAAVPFVKFNDSIFIIDSEGTTVSELSDDYVEVGVIKEVSSKADNAQNGASSCCSVGDKIYQSPDLSNEIYIYTKLFSGNNEYRFLKFNKGN